MAVGRVTEISATSTQNFDHAIRQGLARANQTLRECQICMDQGAAVGRRDPLAAPYVNLDEPVAEECSSYLGARISRCGSRCRRPPSQKELAPQQCPVRLSSSPRALRALAAFGLWPGFWPQGQWELLYTSKLASVSR